MTLSPAIMGIVNVTPDSFFPASRTVAAGEAIERGRSHFRLGADVVDVGGESTRPGAEPVDEAEELARVIPVVRALADYGPVSIDTQKGAVAVAAIDAGATVLNDVSATLYPIAGERGVGYVAMHRQGDARVMQMHPHYVDVLAEVAAFLDEVAERARCAGVTRLWLDPGIGFGKTVEHNLTLVAHCARLVERAAAQGAGVLLGTSRKSFLAHLGGVELSVEDRLEGTLATEAWAMIQGVSMIRAHDVAEAVQLREVLTRPLELVGS